MAERLERFRLYMDNFDAAADPRSALKRDFYVPPPARGDKSKIAVRAQLEPSGSQLIVGGIGTGKTTELLIAKKEIESIADDRELRGARLRHPRELRELGDDALHALDHQDIVAESCECCGAVRR